LSQYHFAVQTLTHDFCMLEAGKAGRGTRMLDSTNAWQSVPFPKEKRKKKTEQKNVVNSLLFSVAFNALLPHSCALPA